MLLFPSIDLRDGRVVRLLRGDYDAETRYDASPVDVARAFEAAGARWIHVVDLDAARSGGAANLGLIEAVCAAVDVPVQSGGGIRSIADAGERFAAGVQRVVVGSAAVDDPELVDALIGLHPGGVAVGLDARGRDLATHGWTRATGADLVELARHFSKRGVDALVVTSIGVDGTLEGPDLVQLRAVLEACDAPLIASGGVGKLDDLRSLAALEAGGRRLAGAIVGRAIYENRFTVEEAVAACSQPA